MVQCNATMYTYTIYSITYVVACKTGWRHPRQDILHNSEDGMSNAQLHNMMQFKSNALVFGNMNQHW